MIEKSLIELARESGLSYQTIFYWVWQRKLKARKVNGRWMVSEADAERFIQEHKARKAGNAKSE